MSKIDRQLLAAQRGWSQEKLEKAHVAVVGSTNLAQLLVTDFLAMEFGTVTWCGRPSIPTITFDSFNPQAQHFVTGNIFGHATAFDEYVGKPDFLIDAVNDPEEKMQIMAYSIHAQVPLLSCSASKTGIYYKFVNANDSARDILQTQERIWANSNDGTSNSVIAAGLISDNIRKRISPLTNEKPHEIQDRYQLNSKERNAGYEERKPRILQIGAGGTGNFAALTLSMQGLSADIMDNDVVEESNLSRQVLFSDADVANRANKAKALASRLGSSWRFIDYKFGSDFSTKEKYDVVLCCVDNNLARYHINKYCMAQNIPLINCGTGLNHGVVMPVVRGETACLDCQVLGELGKAYAQGSSAGQRNGGGCHEAAIVTPNQIVGALLADRVRKVVFDNNLSAFTYRTTDGIIKYSPFEICRPVCR